MPAEPVRPDVDCPRLLIVDSPLDPRLCLRLLVTHLPRLQPRCTHTLQFGWDLDLPRYGDFVVTVVGRWW